MLIFQAIISGMEVGNKYKFKHNISKITQARAKNPGTWDMNITMIMAANYP